VRRNGNLRQAISRLPRGVQAMHPLLLCVVVGLLLIPALAASAIVVHFSLFRPSTGVVVGLFWAVAGTAATLLALMYSV